MLLDVAANLGSWRHFFLSTPVAYARRVKVCILSCRNLQGGVQVMAKQTKATRKFEKNNLKGTLERRKDFAKVKQRHQLKAKKKQRAEKRAAKEENREGHGEDDEDFE